MMGDKTLYFDGWRVEPRQKRLCAENGKEYVFESRRPVEILRYLAEKPGVWVSQEELRKAIWQEAVVIRTVKAEKRKLLEGLEHIGFEHLLESERFSGYRLMATPRQGPSSPMANVDRADLTEPDPSSKPFLSQGEESDRKGGSADYPDFPEGEVLLNRFEIRGVLGKGSCATVYLAHDETVDEEVALKTLPTFGRVKEVTAALEAEYRRQREIKDRTHIVEMDRPLSCTYAGIDWVLLPMEKGEKSFRDWLQETRPDVECRRKKGVQYLEQACWGVKALHEAGLVHRDLKPENLLLMGDEESKAPDNFRVKVTDFGLARDLRRPEEVNPKPTSSGVGTPWYMAPEQVSAAREEDIGPAADTYALGVILFELLDGALPFDGTPEEVKRKHQQLQPNLENIPHKYRYAARKCLEKEPKNRHASAQDLIWSLVVALLGYNCAYLKGTLKDVQEVLEQRKDVHERSHSGATILMNASNEGDPKAVQLLLKNGAQVNEKDNEGWTPLMIASRYGHSEVVWRLLEKNAEVNVKHDSGQTPLQCAIDSADLDTVQLLLKAGALVNERWSTCRPVLSQAACGGKTAIVKVLLNAGADVEAKDENGVTALMIASFKGHTATVELLLKAGANVNTRANKGATALGLASSEGRKEIVRLLKRRGARARSPRSGRLSSHF